MRKLKLLLVLCALLCAGTTWAQTDVTSTYLTNPSFELGTDGTPTASAASGCYDAPFGWVTDGIAGGTRNFGIFNAQGGSPSAFGTQVAPANGDYYYLARNSWSDHITVTYSQTPTLPAGIYSFDIAYKIATRDAASKGTLQLKAIQGGTETKVVSPVSANESGDTFFNTAGWTRLSVPFTVSESGEVTLQIYMDFNPGGGNPQQEAIIIDDVRLYNLSVATETDPADVTGLLVNHSFELDTYTGSKADGSTASSGSMNYPTGWKFLLKTDGWNNCVNITDAPSHGNLARETWAGTINEVKVFQTLTNLPAGVYEISADARTNDGGANDICSYGTVNGITSYSTPWDQSKMASTWNGIDNWQTLTARFALEEAGDAEVGLHSTHFMQFDNFRLAYLGADKIVSDAEAEALLATIPTGKMSNEAQTNLNTAKTNFENKKTETNYNNLSNAIAAANASIAAYSTVPSAIDAATALKEAHNFASASAITTFADAILSAQTAYDNGILSTSDAEGLGQSLGVAVTGWHAAGNTPAVKYLNDGFALNAYDATLYINTWSIEGEDDGSNFKVPFYEYFAGEGSALGANTWTGTLTGLENGLYEVSAWVRVRTMNGETAVADLTGITMDVNGGTAVDVTEGEQVGSSRFQLKEYTAEGLVKDGKLHLNFNIDAENNIHWLSFKNIKYTKVRDLNPDEMTVSDEEIAALIATIPTDKMSDARKNAIDTAKESLLSTKSLTDYNALETAIEAAAASIASYALIASGTIPTNNATGWAISTPTGSLACNTWSTEGDSDGSGMTTPFIQDWASAGNALGEGALYYDIEELTPGEYYKVTALVRAYNEAGGAIDGASFFVNSGNKSLDEVGIACTGRNGKYGNFSVVGQVDENGKLRFGLQLVSTSAINWVAIKNVTIETATGKVPTAIALAEHSTTMGTGTQQTLTATITPEDADDKLIIWTSSDETIATVADGVIKALKAGSATITAKTYAGDNVTTTTTITVADAPAPSFYSEIAAGEFYIMNAATGKFLGGANDWGTRASIIDHGIPFTVAVNDGKYTLASHAYNGQKHFFDGTYIDAASTDLFIVPMSDGKYSISTADGSAFVSTLFNSTIVNNSAADATSTLAQWYFLSKNDRDKMLAAATAENPVDATYYINDANFGRNYSNGWNGSFTRGGNNENQNAMVKNAAADVYQTIENIPNGTYTLTVQSVTSGSAKFYANEVEQEIESKDDVTDQSIASQAFGAGYFKRSLTVNVTDRTLKIGVKSDDTDKVLYFDNFELFMNVYTANTGLIADIDNSEIEAGSTATITAATVPATASFNAITFTSDNEDVATVDENGVVTGVSIGTANITVAATEMESFTQVVPVTVIATVPDALALSETEVQLDATTTTATLTVIPTPSTANTSVSWASSDETVATVVDGVVTAVSTGTAIITANSTVASGIGAEATVVVTFPEAVVPAGFYTNSGATRTICTPVGENLIKNGAFEYPNTFYGWTVGTGAAMSADGFNVLTEGDNTYIKAKKGEGGGAATAIKQVWPIESGKTYTFGYKIKGNAGKTSWTATSLTNTLGTETEMIEREFDLTGDWQEKKYTFTNTEGYAYLQFFARWYDAAFDDFFLAEVSSTIEGNVDYATAAIPTANVGTGAFQYSQDAIDAANALEQGVATVADVEAAYDALTELNEPDPGQIYNLIVATEGHAKNGNAVIIVPGTSGANNPTGYGLNANFAVNENLNQAVTFAKVSGKKNTYNISFETAEGTTYLTYGANNGSAAGWKNSQIQATADESKKGEFVIAATATDNVFNIINTLTNSTIACQNGGNIYTEAGNADFSLAATTQPAITINTKAAGWGTVMLPFAAQIPANVKVYSCSAAEGDVLTLTEVDALEANKPYIIEGAWEETLTGDAQGTALNYTEGWLTGVYVATSAPVGSYVLQKLNDEVCFYQVVEDKQPTVGANRAYLTDKSGTGIKAFFFNADDATGINGVFNALHDGESEVFNAAGARQNGLQKGLNIIRMKDGSIKKVMVK